MPHTLLLADDSVTIRRVIELTFADENVRVVSVSSGRDAIASIESSPPDIVLADAGMSDVSGYDIASFVKSRPHLRHIPVVLLAGAFEPLDEARSRQSGSDGVLVKPFEPQMVVARVRELLSQAVGVRTHAGPAIHSIADLSAPPTRPGIHVAPPADATTGAPASLSIDPLFDASLDRLDAAFADTGRGAPALDATSATDFANDLRALRSSKTDRGGFERQDFGDWDLPVRTQPDAVTHLDAPSAHEPEAVADVFAAPEPVVPPMPAPIALAPKPAPPVAPPTVPHVPAPPATAPPAPVVAAPRPQERPQPAPVPMQPAAAFPLADAFSSLLAAEEGRPHAPLRSAVAAAVPHAALTEADMDVIVDRVIARLGGGVRGAVIDLAERLVKAEIDRLKALR